MIENYSGTEDAMYKARLVVFVEGGLVTQVLSNEPIEVVIVDNDLEGLDDDEISIVMWKESYIYPCLKDSEVNTDVVQQVFRDVDR
jgi:hypothetical protein